MFVLKYFLVISNELPIVYVFTTISIKGIVNVFSVINSRSNNIFGFKEKKPSILFILDIFFFLIHVTIGHGVI